MECSTCLQKDAQIRMLKKLVQRLRYELADEDADGSKLAAVADRCTADAAAGVESPA